MSSNNGFKRTPIRLPLDRYRGPLAVSITTGTADRVPAFVDQTWAASCVRILAHFAGRTRVLVYAYCLMPDHLHLVVQNGDGSSLVDFVKQFKQRSGYAYKRATGRGPWHKRYHDHFLRSEDDLLASARYVFANPVRAGLVARSEDYPFSGSLVWDCGVLVEACEEPYRQQRSSHRA